MSVFLFIGLLWFSGCDRDQSGNFTGTFVKEIQARGGKLSRTNELPIINASWVFNEDAHGFEYVISNVGFNEVKQMLTNAFGTKGREGSPATGATARYCLFSASSVGVGLLVKETKSGVQINCITGGFLAPP